MDIKFEKATKYNKKPTVCPYNDACQCMVKKCNRCGWNPTVAQMRMDKALNRQSEV